MRWLPVIAFWAILYCVGAYQLVPAWQASDQWLRNTPERLPNVRTVSDRCRLPYVDRFIALHDWKQPTLVLLGDSQVFASSIDDGDTWGHLLAADLKLTPLNLSLIDGRPEDTQRVIGRILAAGVSPALSVVDVNRAHMPLEQHGVHYIQGNSVLPWDYASCVFEMRRRLLETNMVLPSNGTPAATFQKIPLSPAYLSADETVVANLVPPLLRDVASIPGPSAAYITPNNVGRFDVYGFDLARYLADGDRLNAICQQGPVDICVNEPASLGDESYIDIVHLNVAGNRDFARLMARHLSTLESDAGASNRP